MQPSRAPSNKPSFSLSDVKKAVPPHCFRRSLVRSFGYLFYDLTVISILVYVSTWIDHPFIPFIIRWSVLWPLYWFFCGAFATGIWVIAHECGHGAFADDPRINDAVGFVMHSVLLVPYFSWYPCPQTRVLIVYSYRKHSHRRHHSNTANLCKDEVLSNQILNMLIGVAGVCSQG